MPPMAAKMASRLASSSNIVSTHLFTRRLTTAAAPSTPPNVVLGVKLSPEQAAKHEENLESISFLPPRLRNFFAKYPPQFYSAAVAPAERLLPPAEASDSTTPASEESQAESQTATPLEPGKLPSPYTPSREAKGSKRDLAAWSASKAVLYTDPKYPNPFLPHKPHSSGSKAWRSPKYGLRQQADLVKLARKHGVEQLLPTTRKSTLFKETRVAERGGLAIKGTGIGQKVKGHKWERTMETRLDERKKAMMEMPEMIREWKQVRSSPRFRFEVGDANHFIERSRSWMEEVAAAIDGNTLVAQAYIDRCSSRTVLYCILEYQIIIFHSDMSYVSTISTIITRRNNIANPNEPVISTIHTLICIRQSNMPAKKNLPANPPRLR
jgi:large subunit ribosomal protein L25